MATKQAAGHKGANKGDWQKHNKTGARDGGIEDEDEDVDPEWVEFDPEKDKSKFYGHVMADE